jgi:hypothetical protein
MMMAWGRHFLLNKIINSPMRRISLWHTVQFKQSPLFLPAMSSYFPQEFATSESQDSTDLQKYSLWISQFTIDKIAALLDSATADILLDQTQVSIPSSCLLALPKLDALAHGRNT